MVVTSVTAMRSARSGPYRGDNCAFSTSKLSPDRIQFSMVLLVWLRVCSKIGAIFFRRYWRRYSIAASLTVSKSSKTCTDGGSAACPPLTASKNTSSTSGATSSHSSASSSIQNCNWRGSAILQAPCTLDNPLITALQVISPGALIAVLPLSPLFIIRRVLRVVQFGAHLLLTRLAGTGWRLVLRPPSRRFARLL